MLPLLAGLRVKWFDPCSSVLDAPVQGWVSHLFFEGQPPFSCCFQDIPCQETRAEAQSKFEVSPVISWLFLAGPAGASEASRGVAGVELLAWPVWLEKLGGNNTRRKIILAVDSPNLVRIVGFVATPLAHT